MKLRPAIRRFLSPKAWGMHEADRLVIETILSSYAPERRASPEWPATAARLLADYIEDTR